jgi:glucokinase
MDNTVLAVDIGGSHITSAIINLKERKEIKSTWTRNLVDASGTSEQIISCWANTILQTIASIDVRPSKVKIAMPGPMDYPGGICLIKDQAKFKSLYGLNIKALLAAEIDFNPENISFHNDAACFLRGELFGGSLYGFDKAIGLTLGTGLGTAHGSCREAKDADLWNMAFLEGIAEDYISTRWFVRRFYELSGNQVANVKELIDKYAGSIVFYQVFSEFSVNLANFIYQFIQRELPLAAVIGGNIAQAAPYFMKEMQQQLNRLLGYSFPVKKSVLGESATLLGAGVSN